MALQDLIFIGGSTLLAAAFFAQYTRKLFLREAFEFWHASVLIALPVYFATGFVLLGCSSFWSHVSTCAEFAESPLSIVFVPAMIVILPPVIIFAVAAPLGTLAGLLLSMFRKPS